MTPRSRSDRTRPRQVDGAIPTRSASALLAIRASRASSRTSCRSMSSSSPGPPCGPAPGAPGQGGRTRFCGPPDGSGRDEFSVITQPSLRIIFIKLGNYPTKMHDRESGPEPRQAPHPLRAAKGSHAMKVGIPREVKNNEYRVAITPAGVHELTSHGHQVFLEQGAGTGSQLTDDAYTDAGATIIPDADEVWGIADMVLKVKEPVAEEYHRMRPGLTLFTYLHLAADRSCTDALLANKVTGIAYETVQLGDGSLPLLAPMSEVAGRLAPQVGAYHLVRQGGGYGALLGGVPGTRAGKVVVIGGGVSGQHAAQIAVGMGAHVTVLDKNIAKLREIDAIYRGRIQTIASNAQELEQAVLDADLVIGAVLGTGAKAPKLVSNDLVKRMKPGSVLVDIAIDQGGCFEDSRPTTHAEPTFRVHNSVFYCVANMPGAVPNTSTYALTNATLPYAVELADKGWRAALKADAPLALGLNTHEGQLANAPVAAAHGYEAAPVESAIS